MGRELKEKIDMHFFKYKLIQERAAEDKVYLSHFTI